MSQIKQNRRPSGLARLAATVAIVVGTGQLSTCAPPEREIRRKLVDEIYSGVLFALRAGDGTLLHGGADSLECANRETKDLCQRRPEQEVTRSVHLYRDRMNSVRDICRDEVMSSLMTTSLSYSQQVQRVAECVATHGFRREIATIRDDVGSAA
jgi:hypothetical protein